MNYPRKQTPEIFNGLLKSISKRIPYAIAAYANGIHEDTLYEWIKRGKKDIGENLDTPLAKFVLSLHKIEQKRISGHLSKIRNNVERWQADAWILERKWWKYYSSAAPVLEFEERLKRLESEDKSSLQADLDKIKETKHKDVSHGK